MCRGRLWPPAKLGNSQSKRVRQPTALCAQVRVNDGKMRLKTRPEGSISLRSIRPQSSISD